MRIPAKLGFIIAAAAFSSAYAQAPSPAAAQKSLAATLNVYAFPGGGQSPSQQSKDETECYNWAVTNTGSDPFLVAKQAEEAKQQAAQTKEQASKGVAGSGARSAVRGAAAGAIIGEIANDDAGKGAVIGGATGVVAGRSRARGKQQQAAQQATQQEQAAAKSAAQQTDAFKKAFGACLEAKKYTVKF